MALSNQTTAPATQASATRRVLGFFLWGAAGFSAALTIASLPSIGLLVLPVTLALAGAAAIVDHGRASANVLVGVGVMGLALASIHRGGPGLVCNDAASISCRVQLDPRPFFEIGMTLVVVGLLIQAWIARTAISRVVKNLHSGHQGDGNR